MKNYAGIERIISSKLNYIAEDKEYHVTLTTYEQQYQKLPFKLNNNITYCPIDVLIPQRVNMTFIKWVKAYLKARILFKKKIQTLLQEQHPDIVVVTGYSFQVLDIIINICKSLGIRTIIESHTKGETVTLAYKFNYNHTLYRIISLWDSYIMKCLSNCDCVVTLTQQDAIFWKKHAMRIEVIPNMLTIKPKNVIDYNVKRVIAAGRYMPEKGFDLLLETWNLLSKNFPDWDLYIFGNEDRNIYESMVHQYHIDKQVHLMNATDDIAEEFSKSSIYVMSSRYEGFGLVLAEAMSCGLPCISFDCPYGPKEIINNGEDGFLVTNGDVNELAKTMQYLMLHAELRKSMGEKAIKNIIRFHPEIIMGKWFELFKSI